MKVIRMHPPAGDAVTRAFASVEAKGDVRLEIGMAQLRAGQRVPLEGTSRHRGTEVSYVLSGLVEVVNEEGTRRISSGDLVIVPGGEWHYSSVIEEATLVYAFLEDRTCE
jgi:quercetin dioxygenase-like cupin family protein